MHNVRISELFDTNKTIAKDIFCGLDFPWEVLPKIHDYIIELGNTLPEDKFHKQDENVWIANSAKIYPNVYIEGPCIIDEEAEIRPSAFIRGNAIVGKKAVVGNSTELKNVILFDEVQVPHFNYVGDSILGYKAHLAAGVITSNLKGDKSLVQIKEGEEKIDTNIKKVGAFVGDFAEVGCNSVLSPGTVLGRNVRIYPLSFVRGVVKENSLYKDKDHIVQMGTSSLGQFESK